MTEGGHRSRRGTVRRHRLALDLSGDVLVDVVMYGDVAENGNEYQSPSVTDLQSSTSTR
jgi:hypothetical protein